MNVPSRNLRSNRGDSIRGESTRDDTISSCQQLSRFTPSLSRYGYARKVSRPGQMNGTYLVTGIVCRYNQFKVLRWYHHLAYYGLSLRCSYTRCNSRFKMIRGELVARQR